MRRIGPRILAIGSLFATCACGPEASNSAATIVDRNTTAAAVEADNRTEGTSSDNDLSWLRKPTKLRVGDQLVDDDVPADAIPMIKRFGELYERCLNLKRESLCREGDAIAEKLEERDICRGRWSDPLDAEGHKLPSWHICESTSWQRNGI